MGFLNMSFHADTKTSVTQIWSLKLNFLNKVKKYLRTICWDIIRQERFPKWSQKRFRRMFCTNKDQLNHMQWMWKKHKWVTLNNAVVASINNHILRCIATRSLALYIKIETINSSTLTRTVWLEIVHTN